MSKSVYEKMMNNYPILYCMRNKSEMESCMCWGIEANEGWYEPLNNLSFKLETLNKFYYTFYNIRIQADQVKEKYGTLHFYYSVIIDPPKYKRVLALPFIIIDKILNKITFKFKTKRVEDPTTEIKWEEISKEKYDKKDKPTNITNYLNSEFKEENGKYYRSYEFYNPGTCETILLNHKLLWKIKCFCNKIKCQILFKVKPTNKQLDIVDTLNELTQLLINNCEDECYNICEICGSNTDIVTTHGWITRICKQCAEKGNRKYE